MKDLQVFIESIEDEPFKTTKEWMTEKYAEYNEKLFSNELPKSIELVVLNGSQMKKAINGNALGCMGYDERISFVPTGTTVVSRGRWYTQYEMQNDMYVGAIRGKRITDIMEAKPHIYMNTAFDNLNQLQHEDTLIHEMIHLWVEKDGLFPKRAHGKEFKAKCREVRKLAKEVYGKTYWLDTYADVESKTAEETAQKQLDNKIWKLKTKMWLMYIEMNDGEIRLIWSENKSFGKVYRDMLAAIGKENIKLVVEFRSCYDRAYKLYGNFSNSKKYRGYYKGSKYDKLIEWCKNALHDEAIFYYSILFGNMNESKYTFQPEPDNSMAGFLIPIGVDMSTFNIEDYLKALDSEDVDDLKGDEKNEKNFVEA